MKRLYLALILLVLATWPAYAQSPVTVIGPITANDCVKFNSTTIITDAGFICTGQGILPNATVAGTVLYYTGTAWVIFAGNTSGTNCLGENAVGAPQWTTCSGGSGANPGGTDGQIQYNAAGTFGGYTVGSGLTVAGGTLNPVATTNSGTSGHVAYYATTGQTLSGLTVGNSLAIATGTINVNSGTVGQCLQSTGSASIATNVCAATPQLYDASCGTPGHDCTTGMNDCIATLRCFVPCGTYDTATGFSLSGAVASLDLRGAGYCSFVRTTTNTVSGLTIGDGTHGVQHGVVTNIRFGSSAGSPGNCITAKQLNMITFRDLWLDGGCLNGIVVTGVGSFSVQQISLENVQVVNCAGAGIVVYATGASAQFTTDMNTAVSGCAGAGVWISGGIGGAELNNLTLANGVDGLLIDQSQGGVSNAQIFLGPFFDSDTNGRHGVNTGANAYQVLFCQACWSSSNTGAGFALANTQSGGAFGRATVEIAGAAGILGNLSTCAQICVTTSSIDMTVAGGPIIANGTAAGPAIQLSGASNSNILISGVIMHGNEFPVYVSGTAPTYLSIVGNIESGNTNGNSVSAAALVCTNNNGSNVSGGC